MLLQSSNYYLPIAFIYPTLNDLMRINCDMIAHLSCSFITSSSIYADLGIDWTYRYIMLKILMIF